MSTVGCKELTVDNLQISSRVMVSFSYTTGSRENAGYECSDMRNANANESNVFHSFPSINLFCC